MRLYKGLEVWPQYVHGHWTIFTRDLVNDVAGIHYWLMKLGVSGKIARTLVGRASCGNGMTMQYVFDLFADIRVVRNEDFGALFVMLLGLRGSAIHRLLGSMHYKLNVIVWITIVEKNLANVLKFILQMLWRTNVVSMTCQ